MKQIFINGRFLTQPLTGVQRYAHELLRTWDMLNPDAELVCLAPPEEFLRPAWKNISLQVIGRSRGNAWEQVDLPLWLKGRFLFSPANFGPVFYSNQAVTVHDASVFAVPQAYSLGFKLKYRIGLPMLVRRAKLLLTDSRFSQKELARFLNISPGRLQVVPLGGDHLQSIQADEGILDRHGLRGQPFILMVASRSPHKNVGRLLEAVNRLEPGTMRFVLVGGKNQSVFREDVSITHPAIILLGYVNDTELKALYQYASGFIFPSLYEGFGLPVLEALNCGCPVLSSRAASLPEVGGDAVLYFDPLDVDNITATLEHFLENTSSLNDLRQRGRAQAGRFTWEKTARLTLDLLGPLL